MWNSTEIEGASEAATVEALKAELAAERARTREVDHRAKNSLQLVSSLLLLLSRRTPEPSTQRALKAMHQRIGAIATVHRGILSAADPERFDLAGFIGDHVAALTRGRSDGAVVRLDLDPMETAAADGCAIGLIVNELVLNALAHSGGEGRPPEVSVTLRGSGGGFTLTVQDQGPGLAPGAETAGFGLTIAKLLAQQIGGALELTSTDGGLRATVTGGRAQL